MYPVLLICVYLNFFYGSTKSDENNCGLSRQVLKHAFVSMNIKKSGFHRELVTTVEFSPEAPNRLRILLSYRFPSGLYIDPYQLAPQKEDQDLQVLLNSAIDVETPAHMSAGFTALVYMSLVGKKLKFPILIHGRYHKPSLTEENFQFVQIELPKLMFKADNCIPVHLLPPHNVVDAPCTAVNISMCQWLNIQNLQEHRHVTLEMPLGDESVVNPVCAGTLLVTLLCCVVLSRRILKNGQC
ncbi:phosphatidylinositol-glycan biosynthesis class X protein isoform X1 [Osmerus mordax]|uniref:phosphatidylinositol-glycan biosynthesis class X protein isoform X1 n=1 Tax=Osmerus mordax TaxID=8014 RepID=UPI00350F64B1